jgi:FkbM family methyltransferase
MILQYNKNLSIKTKLINIFKSLLTNRFAEKIIIKLFNNSKIYKYIVPQEYLYNKGSFRSVTINNLKYELDISNVIDHGTYFKFKDEGFETLINLIGTNSNIIDVGANIGTTAIQFANKAQNGVVYAFEPSISNYSKLIKHIKINKFTNIIPYNLGLGNENKKIKLYNLVSSNPGMKIILRNQESLGDFETIEIKKLDEIIDENIEINFIKIDVEGFEFEVLKGAEKIIDKYKPTMFIELIDVYLKDSNITADMIFTWLFAKGYEIFSYPGNNKIIKNVAYKNFRSDILCIKKI